MVSEVLKIVPANLMGLLFFITMLFVLDVTDYSRYMLVMFAVFSTIFTITARFVTRSVIDIDV